MEPRIFLVLKSPDSAKKLKGEGLKKTRKGEAITCIRKGSGAGCGGTTFNLRMRQVCLCEFKASLVYMVSSRIARATKRALCLKGKKRLGSRGMAKMERCMTYMPRAMGSSLAQNKLDM